MTAIIHSDRLDLIPLTPAVLRAMLAGNAGEAGRLLGLAAPAVLAQPRSVLEFFLQRLESDPALQPWSARTICLREAGIVIGDIGFHSAPGHESLASLSPGGVEFGYSVLESWRRQGIATEAAEALMRWARKVHGVTRFVVSISPNNLPSLGLVAKLGFRKIGSHIDEEDGPEDIFERTCTFS